VHAEQNGVNMITGDIKSQIDRIWDAFWSDVTPQGPDGVFNSAQVDELMGVLERVRTMAMAA
jgi:type I restriction enzyme R subunit